MNYEKLRSGGRLARRYSLHRRDACATEFEFLFFSTRFCFKPVELPKKLVHFLVAA
jgi:hypothetical protein